jgi:hypothetical protein
VCAAPFGEPASGGLVPRVGSTSSMGQRRGGEEDQRKAGGAITGVARCAQRDAYTLCVFFVLALAALTEVPCCMYYCSSPRARAAPPGARVAPPPGARAAPVRRELASLSAWSSYLRRREVRFGVEGLIWRGSRGGRIDFARRGHDGWILARDPTFFRVDGLAIGTEARGRFGEGDSEV